MGAGEIFCVVGLGNPGPRYSKTRHNVGFQVVERLSEALSIPIDKKKFDAEFGRGRSGGHDIFLVRPLSFMNLSGLPLQRLTRFFGIETFCIIVVYDDIDLSFGRIRVREKGGHGGHNGVRSLIENLGTQELKRVRVGIGRPEGKQDLADYVLSDFSREEKGLWPRVIEQAGDAVFCIMEKGISAAMQLYSQ